MTLNIRPDVLLLDLRMPNSHPSELEERLRRLCPEVKSLVLTAHDRDAYLAEMMAAGVSGYLTKDEAPHRILRAIRRSHRGDVFFSEEQMARVQDWRGSITNQPRISRINTKKRR